MELSGFDKLKYSKDLVEGLMDIMVFIETAKEDTAIPIRVFCPFGAVLEKVMLDEIDKKEKGA